VLTRGLMPETMTPGPVGSESAETPLKAFISYRKADTSSAARLLYMSLTPLLGKENLFFDVEVLKPGMNWRQAIKTSANSPGVLLALIGPRWLEALQARSQRAAVEDVDDVARKEIEYSLTNMVDVGVIPVLVEGASMPKADQLPHTIRALTDIQAQPLRDDTYEDDVNRLVDRLKRIATEAPDVGPTKARVAVQISEHYPERYRTVAQHIVGRERVVVVLGSGANDPRMNLPDASKLAEALAREYGYPMNAPRLDLAEVAQYVAVVKGPDDLYDSLREKLTVNCDIGDIHRFFAGLPAVTEQLGYPRQHQLIITTSYDTLLEQAFRDAGEPFDLAVYVASGSDKGKFVHVPGGNEPPKLAWPGNEYTNFPFLDDLELRRSLIVKIYGADDTRDAGYGWRDNFVVTEDNYIEYLSGAVIENLVPAQILERLRKSHCLFLGYDIREWSLRVFLKRVWDVPIRNTSWAVQESPDELEEHLWQEAGRVITLIDEPVEQYIGGLKACLNPPTQ
jgi:hypothetical protein